MDARVFAVAPAARGRICRYPGGRAGEGRFLARIAPIAAAIGLGAAIAGCSSVPEPRAEMAVGTSALAEAQAAGANRWAAGDLARAQAKLEAAQSAVADGDNLRARRLAEQAEADARLASARSRSRRAELAVSQLNEDIRVMREELARTPG